MPTEGSDQKMNVIGDYLCCDKFKLVLQLAHLYSLYEYPFPETPQKQVSPPVTLSITVMGIPLCDYSELSCHGFLQVLFYLLNERGR